LHRLEAAGSHQVRCVTRRPELLVDRAASQTEIVAGDVLDRASLEPAMRGVHTAYYLIHSMDASDEFAALDREGAQNFAESARAAGVRRIVYLGGLGAGEGLSAHLASRQEVGQILRSSGVPTIEFRASIVIGSGSASYEIVRALAETLPVMVTPRWVETAAQPVAIEDLIDYLLGALKLHEAHSAVFEIGGADRVTYAEIVREYARQRGLRRRLVRSPLFTPRASRFFLGLVTPVYGRIAGAMVESLRNETVVNADAALESFAVRPRGLTDAIARALVNEDRQFAETRWSDALPPATPRRWRGIACGRRLVSSRAIKVNRRPVDAFDPIRRIGGHTGWYAADWFWRTRGLLDTLRGGVGLRRGRRDPVDLRVGDTVDFWHVESLEADRLLRLAAEMKIPGRLWLQFEVDPDGNGGAQIRQTTVFDPAGYVGLAYWCLFCPIHELVFGRMLQGISQEIRIPARAPKLDEREVDARLSWRKRHALDLFAGLPSRYHRMGAILSFGQDPRWRRALVAGIEPRPDQRLLDVATGTGLVAFELARRGCREVVGVDQSEQMLAVARAELAAEPELADRVRFITGEAERLPFADAEFDALTFTYLLRYVDDPASTMRELARVVAPGGRIGMVEFGVPQSTVLRGGWRVHTRVGLPLLGRLVSPAWYEVGRFLGPSIEEFHAIAPDLPQLWRSAGIRDVHVRRPSFGAGLVMWGIKDGKGAG
jgi:ubiquinone/menaquinone biosynthesis methyltransferase